MKKVLLALTLLATASTAFANDGTKPTAKATKKDNCTGATAAMCSKGMTAGASMAGMPACCQARMAKMTAAKSATAATKTSVVKSL